MSFSCSFDLLGPGCRACLFRLLLSCRCCFTAEKRYFLCVSLFVDEFAANLYILNPRQVLRNQKQAGWAQGQVRQGQARQGRGGKSKRRVTSKDSLFHHHHPNFYDFFPRAIAPFTGKHTLFWGWGSLCLKKCLFSGWNVFRWVLNPRQEFQPDCVYKMCVYETKNV